MKNIFRIFILSGIITCFSCDNLLEEQAYDIISTEQLGDSKEAASQLLMGAYSTINTRFFSNEAYTNLCHFDSDYASGASWAFGNVGAGNPQGFWGMDHMWQGCYSLIQRSNLGISKVSKMSNLAPEDKDNIIGQFCFLKAWAYFTLVRNYGPVPIFRKGVSEGEDMSQPRSSIKDVYAYIIELLKEAEQKIYSKDNENFIEGCASSGAAKALLAKTYANMASGALGGVSIYVKGGDPTKDDPQLIEHIAQTVNGYEEFDSNTYYELARDKAWEVIEEYTLFDKYMDAWAIENRNKGENIWMCQSKSGDEDYGNVLCQHYVGIFREDGSVTGRWYGMRHHWYKLFEEQDLRIVDGVLHRLEGGGLTDTGKLPYYYYPKNFKEKVENKEAYNSQGDRYDGTEKFIGSDDEWGLAYLTKFTFVTDRTQPKSDFYFPLLRLPDIMLIYAEAVNELNGGPTTEAYNQINRIRTRSNASEFKNMSQVEFRSAVLEERARELAYEANRRYDLLRWGIYLSVMNVIDVDENSVVKRRTERNLLYPLPVSEINANDKIDSNNPGY